MQTMLERIGEVTNDVTEKTPVNPDSAVQLALGIVTNPVIIGFAPVP